MLIRKWALVGFGGNGVENVGEVLALSTGYLGSRRPAV
jgi:hypothetical protein